MPNTLSILRMNRNQKHNFVYFGTPEVARDTLVKLIEREFVPALVVTSPDAPRGRGLVLASSPVKAAALGRAIPVVTPERLDGEAIDAIRAYGCDYAVVVAYGKIFPEPLIAAFPAGVLNVHYSLLPKYRGATPLESALLAGDSVAGVTVQKMTRELDAGDILAQETIAVAPSETIRELRPRLISLGATLLADTLPAFLRGELVPTPQDSLHASHTRKLKKEDGLLSLDAPAQENWNKYRAYADTIGTYFFENGKRMKITGASLKDGRFVIERVIPEGKRETDYGANRQTKKSG